MRNQEVDPPSNVLYQFYLAEKRREKRLGRWRMARTFAAWIFCGLVISYLCWLVLR